VAWRDNRNDYFDIFCKQFSNDGTALGNSFQVNNDCTNGYRYSPCVSINTFGNFIIAWTDVSDGNSNVYGQQYLIDGTSYGNNFRVSISEEMLSGDWEKLDNGEKGDPVAKKFAGKMPLKNNLLAFLHSLHPFLYRFLQYLIQYSELFLFFFS
jgi:hypothetical protein